MWKDIEWYWKIGFSNAWDSFVVGSIPIGAIVLNEKQEVVSTGRNSIFEESSTNLLAGTQMGHAELSALIKLKDNEHPNMNNYTLISTMEPCPMCFGTMVIAGIRNLEYAAKDSWAGATEIAQTLEYIKIKNLKITRVGGELEVFQICLQSAFELSKRQNKHNKLLDSWRIENLKSVELACDLHDRGYFEKAIQTQKNIADIYDEVCMLLLMTE